MDADQPLIQEMDDSVVLRFENRPQDLIPLCRFCRHPHSLSNPLVVPCQCTHEHRFVHATCMRAWIAENSLLERPECHVCGSLIHVDVSFCRLCHGHGGVADRGDHGNELIAPCRCEGSAAFVHRNCLTIWFAKERTQQCPRCRNQLSMRQQVGPTNFSLLSWGVPACKPYHKTAFLVLCPLYALTSVGLFLSFAINASRQVTFALLGGFQLVSWILLFVAIFVRVYTEGRFMEFCSRRGNCAPLLPVTFEPRTSEVGRLAASMPLSSPIFQEPRFLRRMVQDFATDDECFVPNRPSASADAERSTKSDAGEDTKGPLLKGSMTQAALYGSI